LPIFRNLILLAARISWTSFLIFCSWYYSFLHCPSQSCPLFIFSSTLESVIFFWCCLPCPSCEGNPFLSFTWFFLPVLCGFSQASFRYYWVLFGSPGSSVQVVHRSFNGSKKFTSFITNYYQLSLFILFLNTLFLVLLLKLLMVLKLQSLQLLRFLAPLEFFVFSDPIFYCLLQGFLYFSLLCP